MTLKNRPKPLPAYDLLHERYRYDSETGQLFWRGSFGGRGAPGREAFLSKDTHGYLTGKVNGKSYFAHRIIWKMVTGRDPLHIDHIDRNPLNNRFENLRSVNATANHRNRKVASNSKTGISGVTKNGKRWRACVTLNDRTVVLGDFQSVALAAAARRGAEKVLGYGAAS